MTEILTDSDKRISLNFSTPSPNSLRIIGRIEKAEIKREFAIDMFQEEIDKLKLPNCEEQVLSIEAETDTHYIVECLRSYRR